MSYMKKIYPLGFCRPLTTLLLAALTLSFAGCGDSSIAPVSGKVTIDGAPVAGIRVVFSPILVEGENETGPWSSGLTDESGTYTLETRYKDSGAAVGEHSVSFSYDDIEKISLYRELLREAKQEGDQAAMAAAQKDIADYNALQKTRPKSPGNYTEKFLVEPGGTTEANFVLPE